MTETTTEKQLKNSGVYIKRACLLICMLAILSAIRLALSLKIFEINPGHRYSDTAQQNLLTNPYFQDKWVTYKFGAADGKVHIDGSNIILITTKSDAIDWHLQFGVPAPTLKQGVNYTASFRARTETPREVMIWTPSSSPIVKVGYNWKEYNIPFQATQGNQENVLVPHFFAGAREGKIWITDLKVTEAK